MYIYICGLTLLIPFITGGITHLLSGLNHQRVPIEQRRRNPLLWVWIAGARNHRGQICCADAAPPGNGAGQAPAALNRCGFGPNKKGPKDVVWNLNGLEKRENFNRKPWFLPFNMGFSCKFSPKPIHWTRLVVKKNDVSGGFSGFREMHLFRLLWFTVNSFKLRKWWLWKWLKSPQRRTTC